MSAVSWWNSGRNVGRLLGFGKFGEIDVDGERAQGAEGIKWVW